MTQQIDEISNDMKRAYVKKLGSVEMQSRKAGGLYWNNAHPPKEVANAKAKHEKHVATAKKMHDRGAFDSIKPKPKNEEFEMNENLENILVHAWNKDAVNLRDALDSEMQSRISDHVDSMVADVSARLFNPALSNENEG